MSHDNLILPPVVSRGEWLLRRRELLEREKELTRARDELDSARRELAMVEVSEDDRFASEPGEIGLLDLRWGVTS